MNLFFLSIWWVGHAVNSIRQLSLRFQLWFQGLQRLCFRWWFLARSDAVSLTIPCINDDSVFYSDFMRQSWISIHCRFHQSVVTQFSKMISRFTVTQFSLMISGWAMAECVWQFHALAMNLFLLSIWCVGRVVDSIRQLSLKFQLWFQGLHRLCFCWQFLGNNDAVFTNDSMRQRWLCFLYWFHLLIVN